MKKEKVRSILHNKEKSPVADANVCVLPVNHFEKIHPKDEFEMLHAHQVSFSIENTPSTHTSTHLVQFHVLSLPHSQILQITLRLYRFSVLEMFSKLLIRFFHGRLFVVLRTLHTLFLSLETAVYLQIYNKVLYTFYDETIYYYTQWPH